MPRTPKNTCPSGHPYSEENTYVDPRGTRCCRTCRRARTRIWHHQTEAPALKAARREARAGYRPPPIKVPCYSSDFGNWLSGFTDGEGSFLAGVSHDHINIKFSIKLRDDDRPVLENIRTTLGIGSIYASKPSASCRLRANPACEYAVTSLIDLHSVIVPHFDLYQLRAKKASDFAIWREIVTIAVGYKRGGGRLLDKAGSALLPRIQRLREVRRYRPRDTPPLSA